MATAAVLRSSSGAPGVRKPSKAALRRDHGLWEEVVPPMLRKLRRTFPRGGQLIIRSNADTNLTYISRWNKDADDVE